MHRRDGTLGRGGPSFTTSADFSLSVLRLCGNEPLKTMLYGPSHAAVECWSPTMQCVVDAATFQHLLDRVLPTLYYYLFDKSDLGCRSTRRLQATRPRPRP